MAMIEDFDAKRLVYQRQIENQDKQLRGANASVFLVSHENQQLKAEIACLRKALDELYILYGQTASERDKCLRDFQVLIDQEITNAEAQKLQLQDAHKRDLELLQAKNEELKVQLESYSGSAPNLVLPPTEFFPPIKAVPPKKGAKKDAKSTRRRTKR